MPGNYQARPQIKPIQPISRWRDSLFSLMSAGECPPETHKINVGSRLQALRTAQGLSLRALADISGLNFNTLCLIENEKSSPNVNTLQQLAVALGVPITAFFEPSPPARGVIFQKAEDRPRSSFTHCDLEDLGAGMALGDAMPLLLSAKAHSNSGAKEITHTGQELVFCLDGTMTYSVGDQDYQLEPGDSLMFQAHIPHRWENRGAGICRCLLIICPSDPGDCSVRQHWLPEQPST